MELTRYLRKAGYDLIDSPVRNHKPGQLWLKTVFNRIELYYDDISMAFKSPVELNITEDPALNVDTTKSNVYGFNIGVSMLGDILKSSGLGNFDLSAKVKSGRKVSISYDNSVTKVLSMGEVGDYLSRADFIHPNPSLLRNANRNHIILISGVVFSKNLVVDIETDFNLDAKLMAELTKAAEGKLNFTMKSKQNLKMDTGGNSTFPVAIKANRLDFDKGHYHGATLVSDNRNFF